MAGPRTEILLATYNGAQFLPDLLASLDRQTERDWTLVVRDDGSTDGTAELLKAWGADQGARFRMVEDGLGNLRASGNFGALLDQCAADYFLPCDQDDVWFPDKVARLRQSIEALEAVSGREVPLLVHSDLVVTDEGLNVVADSFWRYQRLNFPSDSAPWKSLALQNVVTGCAMIGNAALLRAAMPVPSDAMMHDWWLALVAAARGRIGHEPTPSVYYRQHGKNTLGAKSWAVRAGLVRLLSDPAAAAARSRSVLQRTQAQARAFLERYGADLTADQARFFEAYAALSDSGLVARKAFPFRHRLWFDDMIRNVGLLAFI